MFYLWTLIISIWLVKSGNCLNLQETEDMLNGVGKTDLFVSFANVHTNPEKLFYIMQKNVELRRNLNDMMKQRKKQLAYESYWELRRG